MRTVRLTGEEKTRLKNIWQRSCKEGETFIRCDMNFVLWLLRERTDLIDQAFSKDSDDLAHLLPARAYGGQRCSRSR